MEIKSLTGVRGIFACYVMAFHLFTRDHGEYLNTFLINGYLSVDFFFLLSGFIMSMVHNEFSIKGKGDYVDFMYKRFCRIYPLYLFLLITTILITSIHTKQFESPILIFINATLFQSFFGYNYIASSWSISTELFAYMAFPPLIFILSQKRNIIPFTILSIAALIYITLNNNILTMSVNVTGGWQSVLRCLSDYVFGVTAYVLYCKGIKISRNMSYIFLAFVTYMLFQRYYDIYIILLCAAIIPSLTDKHNIVSKFLSTRPVHYLGKISFSLYLIHSILINQISFLFDFAGSYKIQAVIILSFMLSALTYHFVETPSRKYLSKRNTEYKINLQQRTR